MGNIEIAGSKAAAIFTNPYGITCNGCGFINASHVVLASATIEEKNSKIIYRNSRNGSIHIQNTIQDPYNDIEYFHILSNQVKIHESTNFILNDKSKLSFLLGHSSFEQNTESIDSLKSLQANKSPIPNGENIQFAFDLAAAGAMFAGSIYLISTSQGVGVRVLGSMNASTGDIEISSKGDIEIGEMSQSSSCNSNLCDARLQANKGNIYISNLDHGIINRGNILAQRQLNLYSAFLYNYNTIAGLDSTKIDLSSGYFYNYGQFINKSETRDEINHSRSALIFSGGDLKIYAKSISNQTPASSLQQSRRNAEIIAKGDIYFQYQKDSPKSSRKDPIKVL